MAVDPSSQSWLSQLISGDASQNALPTVLPGIGAGYLADPSTGVGMGPTYTPTPPPLFGSKPPAPPAPVASGYGGDPYTGMGMGTPAAANPQFGYEQPPPPPQAPPVSQAGPASTMADPYTGMGMGPDVAPTPTPPPPAPPAPLQAPGAPPAAAPPSNTSLPTQLPGVGSDTGASDQTGYIAAPQPIAPAQADAQSVNLAAKLAALKKSQAAPQAAPDLAQTASDYPEVPQGTPTAPPVTPQADNNPPSAATPEQLGTDPKAPRGIRNNNPLNLTYVSGQPGVVGSDGRFGQYATPTDGVASAVNQMQIYQTRDGLTTPRQIISKWAPNSENDTAGYVASVAKSAGLDPDQPINMKDPAQAAKLVQGMALVENGKPLDPAVALAGAAQALNPLPPGKTGPGGAIPPAVAGGSNGLPPGALSPSDAAPLPLQQITPGLPSGLPGIGYQPSTVGDKLMALGAGMASKPGAAGFGAGLTAMNNLNTQDRENLMKGQQAQAQIAALTSRSNLANTQANAIPIKLTQTDNKLNATVNQNSARNDLTQQGIDAKNALAQQQVALRQQQVDNQTARTNQYVANSQPTMTATKALAGATAKDSVKDLDAMNGDYTAAGESLQKISDLQNLIGTEGVTGSTFKEQFQRFAANNLGIDIGVTPAGYSITNKAMSEFNSNQALANGKGFGGRITQNEFKQLQTGVLSLGTDPTAAQAILGTYAAAAQRRMQVAETWQNLAKSDPATANSILTNTASGGLDGWYQQQIGGQFQARGISSDPNAAPPPSQYQKSSDGWQHVAPASPGGQPIRFRINQ